MRRAKSCLSCAPSPVRATALSSPPRAFQVQPRPAPERQSGATGQLDRYLALRQAAAPPVVQRMKDEEEASTAAQVFLKLTSDEAKLLRTINGNLAKFSSEPDEGLFDDTEKLIKEAKKEIGLISEKHAEILRDYAKAEPEVRSAFIRTYFKDLPEDFGKGKYEPEGLDDAPTYDVKWLQSLFDTLVARTAAQSEDEEPYRFRYLAYALQSMGDEIGANQIRHLLALVGQDRKIIIGEGVRTDMSAGPVDPGDNAKATKTDSGKPEDDKGLLAQAQGNLYVFMQLKYGKEIEREANPKAQEIGDVQINLDKDTYLFPIFSGIADERVYLFTTPKFVSVHHENGHLISMLQGKAGLGNQHKYKEALASLTSQEEAFNIFGSPRSDRAYAEHLRLPVRFDHKSLVTYMEGVSTWQDWVDLLEKSTQLTAGAVPELQKATARDLELLVAADWGGKTKYKSKPKGVVAIGTEMAKVKGPAQQLLAAQKSAVTSRERKSGNRSKQTQDLYDLLVDLIVKDYGSLTQLREGIAVIRQAL